MRRRSLARSSGEDSGVWLHPANTSVFLVKSPRAKGEEMRGQRMKYFAGIASVCLLALAGVTSAHAQQVKGMITSRSGDQMTVQGSDGSNTTVVITETTDTRDRKGLFGLEKEHLGATVLIPGLKVDVKGSQDDQGRLVAKTITVDGDDIETSS